MDTYDEAGCAEVLYSLNSAVGQYAMVVLGIDAAWTPHGSSGVALMGANGTRREVIRAAPSFLEFVDQPASGPRSRKSLHGPLNALLLLDAAERIAGAPVDVVAIDMPMSLSAITGSREADRKIARAFSAMHAGPYTPRPDCPGPYGRAVMEAFVRAGFPLATSAQPRGRALIEVSPLAALARRLQMRPTYKTARTSKYWKDLDREARMISLLAMWAKVEAALLEEVSDLRFVRPAEAVSFASLQPFEDVLDAIICAWVGVRFNEGTAEPFGDDDAAIWVPT
jgi:predicted RNase H-like nuclease